MKLTLEGSCQEIEEFLTDIMVMSCDSVSLEYPQDKETGVPCGGTGGERDELKVDSVPSEISADLKEDLYPTIQEDIKKIDSVLPGRPAAEEIPDRTKPLAKPLTKKDLLIEPFQYDSSLEKKYRSLFFVELPDGRVMLSCWSIRIYTTKEKILKIPYPVPRGYLKNLGLSSNYKTAIKHYRAYLASVPPDDKILIIQEDIKDHSVSGQSGAPEKDPDRMYKPMLKGVINTRPGNEDFDKVKGSLEN